MRGLASIWVAAFILCCFFPFVKISPFPTDLQPNALFVAIPVWILLGGYREKIPISLWLLVVPVLFSTAVILFSGQSFGSIRSAGNYVMLFVVGVTSYLIAKKGYRLTPVPALLISMIWGIAALMQARLDRFFLLAILSRQNNSGMGGRGVTSLAPEPTMYAAVIFFILLYVWHEKRNLIVLLVSTLALIQILILARSSTISLALLLFLAGLVIFDNMEKKRFWRIGIVSFLVLIAVWGVLHFGVPGKFKQTRPGFLLDKAINNPSDLLQDESVNDRISHIFFSLKGAWESGFQPHGFKAFATYMTQQSEWKAVFPYLKPSDRIMSGLGAALFETGWMGLFIVISVFWITLKRFGGRPVYGLFIGFVLILTLSLSLPLGFPPIGFLLGVWAAHDSQPETQPELPKPSLEPASPWH